MPSTQTVQLVLLALLRLGGVGANTVATRVGYSQPPDILYRAENFANGAWPTHRDSLEFHTAILEGAPQRVTVRDGVQHEYDTQNLEPDRAPTQHGEVVGVYGDPNTAITLAAGLDADPGDAMTLCSVTKWAGYTSSAHRTVLSAGLGRGDAYQGHFQDAAGQRHVGATRWGTTALHANGAERTDVEGKTVRPFKVSK